MLKKFFVILSSLALAGVGCSPRIAAPPATAKPVIIDYWRVVDDVDAFEDIIKAYRAIHPNVTINYRKFRVEEYEQELLNALAEDRGPDVFSVHNTWMRDWEPRLLPMPAQMRLAFRELQGTLKKEAVWVEKIVPGMTVSQLKTTFVDQVAADAVMSTPGTDGRTLEERIFGLPLALDTLALYYNKDVLNAAGIPLPAQNWAEFQDHVKRATRYDEQGKLLRPAAGIGTAYNVERSFDILSLLMMQNRTTMTDENGFPTFHRIPAGDDREFPPGLEALTFYTDFANPTKEVFTWDDAQPNSFDAFIAGQTAYFFGYAYHLPRVRAQAPKLNFAVAQAPQIDPNFRVNYANYWLEGVSKKTDQPDIAWDFVRFAASAEQAKSYLAKTGKPTAHRELINAQLGEGDVAAFAAQVLTAKSWYRGKNIKAAESAFAELIRSVLAGADPRRALGFAADAIGQTVR